MKTYTDHLGREFKTQAEMLEHWGVCYNTFIQRIRRGWTLEEALIGKYVYDEFGNKYNSIQEFADKNKLTYKVAYRNRDADGILHLPKKVKDCDGNEYVSHRAMCASLGIKYTTYVMRRRRGLSLEQCLSKEKRLAY